MVNSEWGLHGAPAFAFTIFPVAFRALRGFNETARNRGNGHESEPSSKPPGGNQWPK